MGEFKDVNPEQYFDSAKSITVQKTATIQARPATAGEGIATVMKDGHVETKNIAKAGDYVVTNPGGEQYVVPGGKFLKKYTATETPGVFKPSAGPVEAMRLTEDVKFKAPWGEDMMIKKGGVLVRNGPNDIYGIQPQEFQSTYSVLKEAHAALPTGGAGETASRGLSNGAEAADKAIIEGSGKAVVKAGSGATTAAAEGLAGGEAFSLLSRAGTIAGRAAVPVAIGVGVAETGYNVYKGDYKGATKSAGGTAAAIAGGTYGAELGAVGGTMILPGVGTVVGGVVGGVVAISLPAT